MKDNITTNDKSVELKLQYARKRFEKLKRQTFTSSSQNSQNSLDSFARVYLTESPSGSSIHLLRDSQEDIHLTEDGPGGEGKPDLSWTEGSRENFNVYDRKDISDELPMCYVDETNVHVRERSFGKREEELLSSVDGGVFRESNEHYDPIKLTAGVHDNNAKEKDGVEGKVESALLCKGDLSEVRDNWDTKDLIEHESKDKLSEERYIRLEEKFRRERERANIAELRVSSLERQVYKLEEKLREYEGSKKDISQIDSKEGYVTVESLKDVTNKQGDIEKTLKENMKQAKHHNCEPLITKDEMQEFHDVDLLTSPVRSPRQFYTKTKGLQEDNYLANNQEINCVNKEEEEDGITELNDFLEIDEGAYQAAILAESKAQEMRINSVKRELITWKGWRLDLRESRLSSGGLHPVIDI